MSPSLASPVKAGTALKLSETVQGLASKTLSTYSSADCTVSLGSQY